MNADFDSFKKHWVMCDGYPSVKCQFAYNTKKHTNDVTFYLDEQYDRNSRADEAMKFDGKLRLLLHEEESNGVSV